MAKSQERVALPTCAWKGTDRHLVYTALKGICDGPNTDTVLRQ